MHDQTSESSHYTRVFKTFNLRYPAGLVYIADNFVTTSWLINFAYWLAYRHNGFDRVAGESVTKPRVNATSNMLYADLHAANISFGEVWPSGDNSRFPLLYAFGRSSDAKCSLANMPHTVFIKPK